MRTLLLPGLDGTGRLFDAFLRELPPSLEPEVVSYPTAVLLNDTELLARVPLRGDPVRIIAESFSGPLAIRLAAAHPEVRALVLVASFANCPVGWPLRVVGRLLPEALFVRPPPRFVVRRYLLGDGALAQEVSRTREVIGGVAGAVIAARLREVCVTDVTQMFRTLTLPILYLGGTEDRLVAPSIADSLRACNPHVEVTMLDAPHLVLQSRPAEAAARTMAFFEAAERRG